MIRRYTVKRIDVDYYTISEEKLTVRSRASIVNGDVVRHDVIKWDRISSCGGNSLNWTYHYRHTNDALENHCTKTGSSIPFMLALTTFQNRA